MPGSWGLAAATAVPAPALLTSAAGVDPIFAAIERHREAWRLHDETEKVFAQQDDDDVPEPLTGIVIGEYPERESETISFSPDEVHIRWKPTGKMLPSVATHRGDIEANAPKGLAQTDRAAWVEEKWAELMRHYETENAERKAKRNETPHNIAYDAWNDAETALINVTEDLVETRPTTVAGVAAALGYWTEFYVEAGQRDFLDPECSANFMNGLVETLRALAAA